MNVPFLVAGVLSLVAAAIHGVAGEALVVRKLTDLPPTRFGSRSMTMTMVRVTWHITTIAFLTIGVGLAACGGSGGGGACRGIGVSAASAYTAFAVLTFAVSIGQMGVRRSVRTIVLRHPAPFIFMAVATLAWIGSA